MTNKTFVDKQPPVVDAEWLNDIGRFVYTGVPPGMTGTQWLTLLGGNPFGDLSNSTDPAKGDALIATKYLGGGTARTQHDLNQERLSIRACGATGNGVTNDTAAIQAVFDIAKTAGVAVAVVDGTYLIDQLTIENGMRGLYGAGGRFLLNNSVNAGIRLAGQKSGKSVDVSRCTLRDLYIDANSNSNSVVPIWADNPTSCRFESNIIVNVAFGWGILIQNYTVATPSGGENHICNNKVSGTYQTNPATADWYGIGCVAEPVYSTTPPDGTVAPTTDMWRKTFTGPSAQQYNGGNVISGNRIVGGYYGIDIQGCFETIVSHNSMTKNIRGISAQNRAVRNEIVGNIVTENVSSGIHLAFGSSYNIISENTVYTTTGTGEALIQAYVGCSANKITNNTLVSFEATTGSQHGIYVAVHASDNEIVGNKILGKFSKAAIAVASAWDAAATDTYRYSKNSDGSHTDWMANAPTTGVVVKNNTITRVSSTTPSILLDQAKTHAGSTYTGPGGVQSTWDAGYTAAYDAALTDTMVQGNTDVGIAVPNNLYIYEDTSGSNASGTLIGNTFSLPATNLISINDTSPAGYPLFTTYFTMPRGRAHFASVEQNDYFNEGFWVSVLESGIDLNMNRCGRRLNIVRPSTGGYTLNTISMDDNLGTNCRGACTGQRVLIRLDNQTSIIYGTGNNNIRLGNRSDIKSQAWVEATPAATAYNAATVYTVGVSGAASACTTALGEFYCWTPAGAAGFAPGIAYNWKLAGDSNCFIEFEVRSTIAFEISRTTLY